MIYAYIYVCIYMHNLVLMCTVHLFTHLVTFAIWCLSLWCNMTNTSVPYKCQSLIRHGVSKWDGGEGVIEIRIKYVFMWILRWAYMHVRLYLYLYLEIYVSFIYIYTYYDWFVVKCLSRWQGESLSCTFSCAGTSRYKSVCTSLYVHSHKRIYKCYYAPHKYWK